MNTIPVWADYVAAFLLVFGMLFALVGAIGLLKLKNFLQRLHGPTKASTLGVGLALIASLIWFWFDGSGYFGRELLITLFVFITAPISAHLMIKAAMHSDPSLRPPPQGPVDKQVN